MRGLPGTATLAVGALVLGSVEARGQLPVTGRSVSQLSWLDVEMQDLMAENGLRAGLLAVMHNGVIVYQRGFGYYDSGENTPIPENALVRIASCTKAYTGAAIQKLASEGVISLEDHVFDLGQAGGGLLPHDPYPSLGDSRLRDVRVRHLLTHTGGWNRATAGDLTYEECQIAGDMGVTSPPGRNNTMRWILGRPLQFSPGMTPCGSAENPRGCYSNIGFLACGLIVEEVTGTGLVTYLRQNILTPNMWIPSTDLRQGRTFRADQPTREAWYDGGQNWCCFENECPGLRCSILVDAPYGSWDHEARVGQGGLVVSSTTMLELLKRYYVGAFSQQIGVPVSEPVNGSHGGALAGVNCRAWQRDDGTNVFVWFNQRNGDEDGDNYASLLAENIDAGLTAQTNWPTLAVDGFWVEPGTPAATYFGSYTVPFRGIPWAVGQMSDGSRANLKPGNYTYAGTISTKMRIRSPLGLARIGGP
ncbi:Protein flp [Phycisphaerales bacterium]|nr:Protein flp [Phycisphaerales bacterium]